MALCGWQFSPLQILNKNLRLLQETLHKHNDNDQSSDDSYDALEAASNESNTKDITEKDEGRESTSKQSLLKNWPLMSSIIVYCVFSLHDMAYSEVLIIFNLDSYKLVENFMV